MMKLKSKKFIAMMMTVLMSVNSLPMAVFAVETEIGVNEVTREAVLDEEMEDEEAIELLADETIIASGTCGENVSWTLNNDGLMDIRGTGPMQDYYSEDECPWASHRDEIISVTIEDGVTSIGGFAFRFFSNLIDIEIPDSVTDIGTDAFGFCSSLETIHIPYGVTNIRRGVFDECTSLKDIEIPNSVTSIGLCSFFRCSSLTSIEIPDSVESIGKQAFQECDNLINVTLGSGMTNIGDYAFQECVNLKGINIPSKVSNIGLGVFNNCTSMTEINVESDNPYYRSQEGVLFNYDMTNLICCPKAKSGSYDIPEGVTRIEEEAFILCKSLTSISIPEGVTDIGTYAFGYCTNLTSINIPDTVTNIGNVAFRYCESLTSIKIPDGVTIIDDYVFDGCYNLVDVTIGNNVTSIGEYAFNDCNSLKNIEIPNSVTSIGSYAFRECSSLIQMNVPDGITNIEDGTFSGCSSLKEVNIPDSVIYIGERVFNGCSSLENVIIPGGVTSIKGWTFSGCSSLREINIPNSVTSIGYGAFGECSSLINVNIPNGIDTIEGETFSRCSRLENINIPASVTNIGYAAFSECSSLTSMELPNSVVSIGEGAFAYCSSLKSVNIPDGLEIISNSTFKECSSLNDINIPSSVTSIGERGFAYCNNLTSIVFEGSAPEFMENCFYDVTATVYYPGNDPSWTIEVKQSYGGTLTWVEQEKEIASGTAGNLTWELKESGTLIISGEGEMPDYNLGTMPWSNYSEEILQVVIEQGVTRIGTYAFGGCSLINEISFEGSAPEFMENCFYGVTATASYPAYDESWTEDVRQNYGGKLTWVARDREIAKGTIGDLTWVFKESGLLTISGEGKMQYDDGMVEKRPWNAYSEQILQVIIEEGATNIGDSAFYECINLESIIIPDSVKEIGSFAFEKCRNLTSLDIPAGVMNIGIGAFRECNNLTEINVKTGNKNYCSKDGVLFDYEMKTLICFPDQKSETAYNIPSSVTNIGDYAFDDCFSLKSVNIPDSVVTIGEKAFFYCHSLMDMVIPASVEQIGNCAFGWSGLNNISFEGEAPEFASDCFWNVTATAYYPANDPSWTEEVKQDYSGTLTWVAKGVEEKDLTIISQPVDFTGKIGDMAQFTIEAEGEGLTYQWQYCNKGSNAWRKSSMTGADTNTIEAKITEARIGQKYRCVITDNRGNTMTSDEAQILRAEPEIKIVSQPTDYAGLIGAAATFSVEAVGDGLNYQWQYCNKGSNTWRNSSTAGADTNHIEIKITEARIGQKYRCVITAGSGYTVTTDEAQILRAEPDVKIISQPADYAGTVGDKAVFTVEAEGEGLTYQWQYCNKGSNTWRNSSTAGADTNRIEIKITEARIGQKYRCVITAGSGYTVTTDEAQILRAEPAVKIISQPADYAGTVGDKAVFAVEAEGEELTYQWQYCNKGSNTWRNSSTAGADTNRIEVKITEARIGQKYRCVITAGSGYTVITEEVQILLAEPAIKIISQPSDYSGNVGDVATFRVEAEGEGLTYQWQYRTSSGSAWRNSGMDGATTQTLNVQITKARNGQSYRCIITDMNGNTLTSEAAVLTVN